MDALSTNQRRARADEDRHALARSQIFYNYAYPLSTVVVGIISVVPLLMIMNRGSGWTPNELKAFRRAEADRFRRTRPDDVVAEAEAHVQRAARRGPAIRPEQVKRRRGLYDSRS